MTREHCLVTKAEIKVAPAKEYQGFICGKSPESRKRPRSILPSRLQREHGPAETLISDL